MDLNLRKAVLHNVSGNDKQQLQDTIVDAIQSGEEKMLPGLGVLFEVLWNNADEKKKDEMLGIMSDGLKE
ncbi:small acid-soluble spore protein SspI [Fictibacillus aquaticus]|jgi:small acid-soluble spore protein I (minor)|uniref:Small, acid-soluble spore protein I n=1 Tax=Fictibacillus aquaticus TaxID=2021314 RepID=A0A235FAY5_9BACL|nr:small acid-soluble spore protein SspI [Fictibacillus aquaticus]OYD58143.1 small acid-soluble spore protein SspI [Fictibacillus aquaticus]